MTASYETHELRHIFQTILRKLALMFTYSRYKSVVAKLYSADKTLNIEIIFFHGFH